MNLEKTLVMQQLFKAFNILKSNMPTVLLCFIVDIAFLFFYGIFTAPIFDKISEHIILIGNLISESLRASRGLRTGILNLLFTETIKPYTINLLILLLVLAFAIFIIYCIFQGINWRMAEILAGRKIKSRTYFLTFARINILWFALFTIHYTLDFISDFRQIIAQRITQAQVINIPYYLLLIFLLAIFYFAIISYATFNIKKAFKLGFKRIKYLLPAFLLIVIYFLALNFILFNIAEFNRDVMFVAGIILFFPAVTLARIYITLVVKKLS